MYYILLVVSIILTVVKSSLYNSYAKFAKPDRHGIFAFNMVCYGAAVIAAMLLGPDGKVSLPTVICAFFYAATVCALQGLSVYAMKIGPMSASALIALYGMIIPTIAGPIFWNEPFGIMQFAGVSLILISMWLLSNGEKSEKSVNKKWISVIIVVFFLSGFAGVIEKIHQSTDGRDEKAMFLLIAYFIMFLFSFAGKIISRPKAEKLASLKKTLITGIVSGLIIGVYAFINLTLAGKLNSMVYYPVANGGALILTVIVSATIFREKCSKKNIIGIIIGLTAVMMLSI